MKYTKKWIGILDRVNKFTFNSRGVWFRGESKEWPKISSGLFRYDMLGGSMNNYSNYEFNLYNDFSNLGHNIHGKSDWELLFQMQHYGARTRLLDWTASFAVALFFATKDWQEEENARIWLLNPYKLNQRSGYEGLLAIPQYLTSYEDILEKRKVLNKTVAVSTVRNSARMTAQQGFFTVQGDTLKSLDEEVEFDNETLLKIVLTPDLKFDVDLFLKQCGVNHFTIFPDLEGLSKYLDDKFKFDYFLQYVSNNK